MSSDLRKKFIDHMDFHGLANHTKRGYIAAMKGLADYYNLPPDNLSNDQVRAYFRHLLLEDVNWPGHLVRIIFPVSLIFTDTSADVRLMIVLVYRLVPEAGSYLLS